METLKYKVITSNKQYLNYCEQLEALVFISQKTKSIKEEIALLTLLIEKWDEAHNIFNDLDPVEILKSLMKDHKMKSYQLAKLLNVSEGLVSDILNYKKGLSKESIRILSAHFKLNQETFNKAYKLKSGLRSYPKVANTINTRKAIVTVR